ncbi:MAG: hypothetical protein V4450_01830 [Bacteroidota bacterium]
MKQVIPVKIECYDTTRIKSMAPEGAYEPLTFLFPLKERKERIVKDKANGVTLILVFLLIGFQFWIRFINSH